MVHYLFHVDKPWPVPDCLAGVIFLNFIHSIIKSLTLYGARNSENFDVFSKYLDFQNHFSPYLEGLGQPLNHRWKGKFVIYKVAHMHCSLAHVRHARGLRPLDPRFVHFRDKYA